MASHELPSSGRGEQLNPNHSYTAYIWDLAETRQNAVAALLEQAQGFGYPVRYWWLSEAMELRDAPDRLIVCVHYPSASEDAGMDVYDALTERGVRWDDLEGAAMEEYRQLGKPISALADICNTDGTVLFPLSTLEDTLPAVDEPLEANPKDFLVYYSLSGLLLVHADDEAGASQKGNTALQAAVKKMGETGLTAEEASQVALNSTEVVIDTVEALEWPQEPTNPPDNETL